MDVNLFTATVRQEFLKGMQAVPFEKLSIVDFTGEIDSKARIESYAWMGPSPGISEYTGRRRLAKLDGITYRVEAKELDASLSVPLRDIEDDLVGGYPLRFNELGVKASRFPERWVMQTANVGDSVVCFDGTNFFATAHNQGGGNSTLPSPFTGGLNLLTYTSANSADAVTGKAIFFLDNPGSGPVKPMLYQRRKEFVMGTNSGDNNSKFEKQVNYWIDGEANSLYGYWWDSVLVKTVNTPSLTDVFTMIDQVIKQALTFTLPQNLPSDSPLYVHQGLDLSRPLGTVLTSPNLAQLFYHALNEDRIGVSVAGSTAGLAGNIYKGRFKVMSSGFIG